MSNSTAALSRRQQVKDNLVRQGFLPIFVHDQHDSRTLIEGCLDAGCTVLEYTCRRHDAREMIPWIRKTYPDIGVVGATQLDFPNVAKFLSATRPHFTTVDEMMALDVDGLVSFMRFRPETYARHADRAVMIPGVDTPNEALEQMDLGADFVKVPGRSPLDTGVVTRLMTPTHSVVPTMVSGGMSKDRIPSFIAAGAVLVSAGFDLTLKADVDAGRTIDRKLVAERMSELMAVVAAARQKHQPKLYEAVQTGQPDPLAVTGFWPNVRGA